MKKLITLILLNVSFSAMSQDTLKIMQYNLLNYGNYTSYCTSGNNNHEAKDAWITTIINHELPDILTVNEISSYEYYHNRILNQDLNTEGRTWYKRGTINNIAGSDIVNMIYYNSDKLVLKSHEVVQYFVRDIDLFTFYCKTPDLEKGDTVFLNCMLAHLKAGSYDSDAAERADMTANTISYLKVHKQAGNYLFMGDLNTYTSDEVCFQNLTSTYAGNFRFYDPVNEPGDWHNNSQFSDWHTQSVTTSSAGCQATGGMDDRFDHILATSQLINGTQGLKYIPGSFHVLAQDGRHFNKSITDYPANTLVPADELTALFSNSDHLPVRMDLLLTSSGPGGIATQDLYRNGGILVEDTRHARLFITALNENTSRVSVIGLTGSELQAEDFHLTKGKNELLLDIGKLKRGVYLVRISDSQGRMATLKMVK